MEPTWAMIPAQSERRALDWSLVLASQGIETLIEHDPVSDRYWLAVSPDDEQRARNAIQQFRRENRARPWRQTLPGTGLIFDWRSLSWVAALVFLFVVGQTRHPEWRDVGLMDNAAVARGEWWRLFTAISLHADAGHLVSNCVTGFLLLGLAMGAFGAGYAVLASYLAGALGNLAGLWFLGARHAGLGASGMVTGALGLLAVQALGTWRRPGGPRQLVLRGLAGGVLLLVLIGTNPNSDVLAHMAGFVGGCLGGMVLLFMPEAARESRWANTLALLTCLTLFAATWHLALR